MSQKTNSEKRLEHMSAIGIYEITTYIKEAIELNLIDETRFYNGSTYQICLLSDYEENMNLTGLMMDDGIKRPSLIVAIAASNDGNNDYYTGHYYTQTQLDSFRKASQLCE